MKFRLLFLVSLLLIYIVFASLAPADEINNSSFNLKTYDESVSSGLTSAQSSDYIEDLMDNLTLGEVGLSDVHTISFTQIDSVVFPGASFLVTFPEGFIIGGLQSATYLDDDEGNVDFAIDSSKIEGNTYQLFLDKIGTTPELLSKVSLVFPDIFNSSISADYSIVLAVLDSTGRLITGPLISEEFTLSPGPVDSIKVTPGGIRQVNAGNFYQSSCNCYDSLKNLRDCGESEWRLSGYNNGTVDENGLFLAKYVGFSKIVCQVDSLEDSTTLMYVLPGALNRLLLTANNDYVTAGFALADSVSVRAVDLYGNTVTTYPGQIWFESSDPAAVLYYNSSMKYQFLPGDQGRKKFDGEDFIFKTAGTQKLYVVAADALKDTSYITVLTDLAADFNLNYPETVEAGQQFNLIVSNVRDAAGNYLEGLMQVNLDGNGIAPDGSQPMVNPVYISGGSGSAVQKLVNTEDVTFTLQFDTISREIGPITVVNGDADNFLFELSTPQVVGASFSGIAKLTARDQYENIAVDYDASEDTVVISALGDGTVVNDSIYSEVAFVNGICDLTELEVGYSGTDRFLKFNATSQSGVEGETESIEFISTAIERITLSSSALYRGDPYTATVTLSNYGSLNLSLDELKLTSSQGAVKIDSIVPGMPDTISGNSSQSYIMYTTVPFNWSSQMTRFKASYAGFYGSNAVSGESGYLDSLKVLSQQEATYVSGSLSPLNCSKGREYDITMSLKNLGENVISLNTDSYLSLSDGSLEVTANLEVPTFLPVSGESVTLFFETIQIPTEFTSGDFQISLNLSGLQGNSGYTETVTIQDAVTIQTAPDLAYVEGSLTPVEVFRGAEVEFELVIENDGEASLAVSTNDSYLELNANGRKVIFTPSESIDTLKSGQSTVTFEAERIPSDFPTSENILSLVLEGMANQSIESYSLSLGTNLVNILESGAIQIAGIHNSALNAPYVNSNQAFTVWVLVANLGSEPLQDIWLKLTAGESTVSQDSVLLETLDIDDVDSVYFSLTAADGAVPVEVIKASILQATGQTTGQAAQIMSSENNSLIATIQTPANIRPSLEITAPPDALDGVLGTQQEFVLEATFDNLGQSDVDLGMAELQLPAGFSTNDNISQAFEIDIPITWDIVCPGSSQNGNLVVEIISPPTDQNTLADALLYKESDTLSIEVVEELPTVILRHTFDPSDLVYPGQSLDIMEIRLTTEGGQEEGKAAISKFAFEFTDRTGAIDVSNQFLSGTILYNDNSYQATFDGNRMTFDFGSNLVFSGDDEAVLYFNLVISDQATIENFKISTDTTLIAAYDYTFGSLGKELRLTGFGGQPLSVENSYGAVPDDFENSFYNYPNPFNPETESTSIVFYLPVNSDVDFEIFTLIGEPVYSLSIHSGTSGALAGRVNQFYWDGVNGDGQQVLEGVYIAVLKYRGGEARTKIAVVK